MPLRRGLPPLKHIHRFFIKEQLLLGQTACLGADDSFHAAKVLRLRAGDRVEVAAGGGCVFDAVVTRVDGASVGAVEIQADREIPHQPSAGVELSVVQALPKGKKMDLVVEKLSELGVMELVPVISEMSAARMPSASSERPDRWRRIARAAAGQSRRDRVMKISAPLELPEWLEWNTLPLVVLATEVEGVPLGEMAASMGSPLALLVGPEAGFCGSEIEVLIARDASFATLGTLLLRTETAALAAAAIIMHRWGVIG